VTLSVVIITFNEEANIARTLASVKPIADEIIVVDSGSTDRTIEIARSYGAKVYVEEWKGFAAQKNSAIEKATGDWILSLDADEEVSPELVKDIREIFHLLARDPQYEFDEGVKYSKPSWDRYRLAPGDAYKIYRKNYFLRRWICHGGLYPDPKYRLFKKGNAAFEDRAVHEDAKPRDLDKTGTIRSPLIHHAYPTLAGYIEHMNRYSSLGAEMAGPRGFSVWNIVVRPAATFIYNYVFRLGFLDGREGLLLHLYHAAYVSWKYAKAWELTRSDDRAIGSSGHRKADSSLRSE
jgi:glycosyltransferase involved in cell wall biosynthesis